MIEDFIQWAKVELGDVTVIEKETCGEQSNVFCLHTSKGNFFLKVAEQLKSEKEKLEWLKGKIAVPEVVGFKTVEDTDALLLSEIISTNLARMNKNWSPGKIVLSLVEALRMFHAVSIKECPFGEAKTDSVLVHGDACLPNFIYKDGILSGYVDLGDMHAGNKETDLSAAVWSLQYNLGKGHEKSFLEQYGVENVTEELVEHLRLQYEDVQKEQL